jgi:hypothetical protein
LPSSHHFTAVLPSASRAFALRSHRSRCSLSASKRGHPCATSATSTAREGAVSWSGAPLRATSTPVVTGAVQGVSGDGERPQALAMQPARRRDEGTRHAHRPPLVGSPPASEDEARDPPHTVATLSHEGMTSGQSAAGWF